MSVMHKLLVAFAACFLGVTVLSAQGVDKTVERSISEYFKNYRSGGVQLKHSGLDKRRNRIVVNKRTKRITIYSNEAFAGQAFTPEIVDTIYRDIRKLLPSKFRKYRIDVVYDHRTIDERIPNIYKDRKKTDKQRLWGPLDYKGAPWVKNASRPYGIGSGLEGRHIALWQSHGRVYSVDKGKWQWQRPSLFCTTEDLLTQSFVVPLLMPMLENAGALVYTPRERDWQPECVIVDNDANPDASAYVEEDGRSLKWRSYDFGYANARKVYRDKENPFAMGTSRYVTASRSDKKNKAQAVWTPQIPVDGHYAVYVSYSSFENSIPDASYTVVHSGGSTEFKVNQTMGGGTWVYLGTFHFKEGSGNGQKVVLTNQSNHVGVVSADAVRFGGGMGNVARGTGDAVSGMPRYLEAARYNLQTGGFPYKVYSIYEGENDYRDDILCRAHAVNYLSGGSVYNPDTSGLGVPLELSFGFHSDAGYDENDNIIGSLGIATTRFNGDTLESGRSRMMSRDAISFLLNNIQKDLTVHYGNRWPVRGILDRNYGETRVPYIPSVILEAFSHQNFADMLYAHDPDFKFTVARSVYKSLLKHLCYVHGTEYVVQPLPVSHFSMSLDMDRVTLKWRPVLDPQEKSAAPDRFVVYTRIGKGGFDNGIVVDRNSVTLNVERGVMYSFKVAALNDGGESLPSEVLSLYLSKKEKGRVLIVNGFHRLDGPSSSSTSKTAGFDMVYDPGVPYMRTPEYCGVQIDHSRAGIGFEDGLGLSDDRYEGMLFAGNTFDYPYVHGQALAANDVSFLSCGSEAVMDGLVDMNDYKVVDLILGVEKQGGKGSYLGYNRPYKTFPKELQQKIRRFCDAGGNLFVSGAYIASDMSKTDADRAFLREVLRCDYGGTIDDVSETGISGNGNTVFSIPRTLNEECYAVPRPDVLAPLDNAFVSFVFDGCRESAGVAYSGKYRVLTTSFPFEAVAGEYKREELMGAVMRFLLR